MQLPVYPPVSAYVRSRYAPARAGEVLLPRSTSDNNVRGMIILMIIIIIIIIMMIIIIIMMIVPPPVDRGPPEFTAGWPGRL